MSPTVVDPPPTATERPQRSDAAAALVFKRRVRIIDRIARALISVSGIGIILAVLGIGLFLFLEILPLFQGARVREGLAQAVLPPGEAGRWILVDEHQERAGIIGAAPTLHLVSLATPSVPETVPIPGLEAREITAADPGLQGSLVALATADGLVWVGSVRLDTVFGADRQRSAQARMEQHMMVTAAPGHRLTRVAYRGVEDGGLIGAIAGGTHVIATRLTVREPLIGPARRSQDSVALPMDGLGQPLAIAVHEQADQVLVGTTTGLIARWRVPAEGAPQLIETVDAVPGGRVTALAYLLGGRSVAVGGSDGSLATWSPVRDEERPDGWRLTRIHPFAPHAAATEAIIPSGRDKGFITVSSDGLARLHFMTSERTLAQWRSGGFPAAGMFAPKANGAVLLDERGWVHHWRIHNPHPEISWRALFGKIWYEGYDRPEYIWQSTGGTDDFESKFSLVPLMFGTLKGTFYALLFAIPLAIFGALYCSQFLEKQLRNPVKSTVELMAALPSVVLGFIAGVLLAPLVQHRIVSVLMVPVAVPAIALGGLLLTSLLPRPGVRTFVRRHEFGVLLAWVAAGVLAAWALGPLVERGWFGGDFEAWLGRMTDFEYDQRNSLVVGWAMGFAVIPIIFTICEDAFSAVPKHLVGASLACGASPWQTAWRVVLPAAGSGVFSAVMIGFGRAIGETMIVLMATGNTPVMDWSIFNGLRALSANIAVEIPEAPYGATLYRVLFVAALLLFCMTFVVNTAAELIRLRLRRQLQGL